MQIDGLNVERSIIYTCDVKYTKKIGKLFIAINVIILSTYEKQRQSIPCEKLIICNMIND